VTSEEATYPEHEKQDRISGHAQVIREFLEHLAANDLTICEWACPEGERRWSYWPDNVGTEERIATYFGPKDAIQRP
jgi:hypothetical protein